MENSTQIIALLENMNARLIAIEEGRKEDGARLKALEAGNKGVNFRLDRLEETLQTNTRLLDLLATQVKDLAIDLEAVKSSVLRIEQEHGERIAALFDGYVLHTYIAP